MEWITRRNIKNGVQLHNNDCELGYCCMNILNVFHKVILIGEGCAALTAGVPSRTLAPFSVGPHWPNDHFSTHFADFFKLPPNTNISLLMLLQVVCPFADVRARRLTHKLLHFDPVHVSDVPGVSTFRNSLATKSAGHLPFINTSDSDRITTAYLLANLGGSRLPNYFLRLSAQPWRTLAT